MVNRLPLVIGIVMLAVFVWGYAVTVDRAFFDVFVGCEPGSTPHALPTPPDRSTPTAGPRIDDPVFGGIALGAAHRPNQARREGVGCMTRESRRSGSAPLSQGRRLLEISKSVPGQIGGSRVGPCVNDSLEVPLCIAWIPQLEVEASDPIQCIGNTRCSRVELRDFEERLDRNLGVPLSVQDVRQIVARLGHDLVRAELIHDLLKANPRRAEGSPPELCHSRIVQLESLVPTTTSAGRPTEDSRWPERPLCTIALYLVPETGNLLLREPRQLLDGQELIFDARHPTGGLCPTILEALCHHRNRILVSAL